MPSLIQHTHCLSWALSTVSAQRSSASIELRIISKFLTTASKTLHAPVNLICAPVYPPGFQPHSSFRASNSQLLQAYAAGFFLDFGLAESSSFRSQLKHHLLPPRPWPSMSDSPPSTLQTPSVRTLPGPQASHRCQPGGAEHSIQICYLPSPSIQPLKIPGRN